MLVIGNTMVITKDDLYNNQYDYKTLKENIYAVSLMDILKTQKLTIDFCIKYILNKDFQLLDEDHEITIEMIKNYQTHIIEEDLVNALLRFTKKKIRGERIDSIEDFESYMNRNL
jgi:hypothetical protein